MISKRNSRGGEGKEIEKYRDWCKVINQILSEIPIEMTKITQMLEEVKDVINSHVLQGKLLYNTGTDDETSFEKVESIIYGTTKLIKTNIDNLGKGTTLS